MHSDPPGGPWHRHTVHLVQPTVISSNHLQYMHRILTNEGTPPAPALKSKAYLTEGRNKGTLVTIAGHGAVLPQRAYQDTRYRHQHDLSAPSTSEPAHANGYETYPDHRINECPAGAGVHSLIHHLHGIECEGESLASAEAIAFERIVQLDDRAARKHVDDE